MDYFERYKRKVNLKGINNKERIVNQKIKQFDMYMNNTPNMYEVNINKSKEKYKIAFQDVSPNNPQGKGDEKYAITYNDTPLYVGTMISWLNKEWVTIDEENNSIQDHKTFKIRPCNHILKWIDKNGEIHEHVALVNNEQLYTTGVTENKFIQWGNSKESILLPSNTETQTIYEDLRLIINRHCWKVTFINEDHKGLLKIMCEQDEFNKEYDNKELGIADYYLYKNTYDFKILNKNPILVTKDNSVEINPQCYKNSTIHSNPQIDYKISDEDIIKIENNKIIGLKNGNCTLEIQYANIKKSINVNVIEQETNNTVIEIDGKKKIAWGNKGAYTITLKNNGQEYTDKVEFMLTDKNNKPTELAKIIDKNNQSCTIQANDKQNDGIVILHCKDRVGNEETMEINICSFWLVGR